MSEAQRDEVTILVSEIEQRFMAKLAKWALAHIVAFVGLTATAVGGYYQAVARVDALERWKSERVTKTIEDYYKQQEALANWMGRVDAKLESIQKQLDKQ